MDNDEILSITAAATRLARDYADRAPLPLTEAGTVASWGEDFAEHVWRTHQEHAAFCETQHYVYGPAPAFALPPQPAPLPIKPPPPLLRREATPDEIAQGYREALFGYSVRDFTKRLLSSIDNGTLAVRDAATGGNCPEYAAISAEAHVSLSEARECLRVQHRISFSKPTLPTPAQQQEQEQTAKAVAIRAKLRKNVLDTPIEKAIQQANSREASAVFLKLKELALASEPPFTGGVDGPALLYTDDNTNTVKGLTKASLEKRLKHYRP